MTPLQLRIITRAVRILVNGGESVEEALDRYPKLTAEEREGIKAALEK